MFLVLPCQPFRYLSSLDHKHHDMVSIATGAKPVGYPMCTRWSSVDLIQSPDHCPCVETKAFTLSQVISTLCSSVPYNSACFCILEVSQSTYNMRRNGKDFVFSHVQTERSFYYNGARCIMSCQRKIRSATPTAVIRCKYTKLGPLIILRSLYDKDHMSELQIKNRSE